jgi:hypothetical protein
VSYCRSYPHFETYLSTYDALLLKILKARPLPKDFVQVEVRQANDPARFHHLCGAHGFSWDEGGFVGLVGWGCAGLVMVVRSERGWVFWRMCACVPVCRTLGRWRRRS